MYRPASGTQHIQLFGGAGYIVYSNVFKSQPASGEVNLPTSPSKTGVATGGDRRTPPNPAGSSPVGGIPSLNEDRLAQHDSRFKNKRESIDNQSVGSGGWELKKTRTRDSLLISTNSDNSGTSSKSSSLPSVLDTDFQRRASFDFNIGVQKESLAQTVLRSTSFDENSRHTPTESQQPEVVENLSPPPHIQPTAHSTFQPYFESSLTTDDIMLLFDFSVKESDARCGGGCKSRKEQFDRMRNGILSYSLQFLKESAQSAIDKRNNRMSSIVEETYSPSNSEKSLRQGTPGTSPNTSPVRSQSGRNMDERSDNNSIQDSSENSNRRSIRRFFDGINQILKPAGAPESLINNISGNVDALSLVNCDSPQSQVTDLSLKRGSLPTRTDGINEAIHSNARMEIVENPPSEPVPLTIICSKSLQIVPWEILLTDVRLVRGMCLLSMCVHVLGPNNIVFEKSRNPDSASFGPSMRKSTLPISETNPLNNQKVHKIKGLLGPTKVSVILMYYNRINKHFSR